MKGTAVTVPVIGPTDSIGRPGFDPGTQPLALEPARVLADLAALRES